MSNFNAIDTTDLDGAIAHAEELKAAGIEYVMGYYFQTSEYKQLLTAERAKALCAAGFGLVSIYEEAPLDVSYFSSLSGLRDGNAARQRAVEAGQPTDTPITLCVDFDAAQSDLGAITNYFIAARGALKQYGYHAACYANGITCKRLSEVGLVEITMLSCSEKFQGYDQWKSSCDILQVTCDCELAGVAVDTDLMQNGLEKAVWKV